MYYLELVDSLNNVHNRIAHYRKYYVLQIKPLPVCSHSLSSFFHIITFKLPHNPTQEGQFKLSTLQQPQMHPYSLSFCFWITESQQQQRNRKAYLEQLGAFLLGQLAVQHDDGSLQVLPLLCDLPLSLPEQLHLPLPGLPQSLQVPALLLLQEAVEVLELGPDLPFQNIKAVLKIQKKQHTCTILFQLSLSVGRVRGGMDGPTVWRVERNRASRTTENTCTVWAKGFCRTLQGKYLYSHGLYVHLTLFLSALVQLMFDPFNSLE